MIYKLRLYITPRTANSQRAISNLDALCQEELPVEGREERQQQRDQAGDGDQQPEAQRPHPQQLRGGYARTPGGIRAEDGAPALDETRVVEVGDVVVVQPPLAVADQQVAQVDAEQDPRRLVVGPRQLGGAIG